MKKNIPFLGIIGLITFSFGLIAYFLVELDSLNFTQIHLILGGLLICWFLFSFVIAGGLRQFGQAAVKRAAGFGFGVTLYSALFVSVLAVINYLAARHDPLHYDSTEQKVYTLAPQSLKVLNALPEEVLVRAFYIGGDMPHDVRDLLNRMAKASDRFRWQVIDPEKNPALVEQLGISERGTLHFSFAREGSTREVKVVRDITEQEVVNSLLKLTRGGEKIIYYLSGHDEGQMASPSADGYLFLKEAIQGENAVVQELSLATAKEVPSDASALLILAPRRELLPAEITAIRRYLSGGGAALIASEPASAEVVQPLVAPLGIELGKDVVLDQMLRLFAGPSVGFEPVVQSYGTHPVTKDFHNESVFVTTSSVRKAARPGPGEVTELAFTSDKSWAERSVDEVLAENPKAALDPEDIRGPVSIAAAFEGQAPPPDAAAAAGKAIAVEDLSDQTDAAEPVDSAEKAQRAAAADAAATPQERQSRVVVFGDADFVSNVYLRQLFNRDLFLNALNWVVGEEEGVTIRARTLRASTQALTAEQFRGIFLLTAMLLPEAVLIWGFGVWWFRKS